MGQPARWVDGVDTNSPNLHIIYGAHNHLRLPKRYILYQTEVAGSHHFSPRYLQYIRRAIAVWDYSATNIPAYRHLNTNIHIVPPWVQKSFVEDEVRDIPILFYGWIEGSPRRQRLLQEINQQLATRHSKPITIITNTLGPEMWHLLRRTRVVLNLHYYDNSPLELFRITEAMSHGCRVVSEPCGINPHISPTTYGVTVTRGAQWLATNAQNATNLPPVSPLSCDGYVQTPLQNAINALHTAHLLM